MPDNKKIKRAKFKKLIVPFMAVALIGIGSNLYLNDKADKELVKISNNQNTPNLECIEEIQKTFSKNIEHSGDGHDVIIIPGFGTNNTYMSYLADGISKSGYKTHGWGASFNFGDIENKAKILEDNITNLYNQNGNKKISLIGYSLGGVYAREVARKHPDLIRNVITLSSPFGLEDDKGNPDSRIKPIFNSYNTNTKSSTNPLIEKLSVTSSSIISNRDLVVNWKSAIQVSNNNSENIVLDIGHMAMPFSEQVINIVLDRLEQKEKTWRSLDQKYCSYS